MSECGQYGAETGGGGGLQRVGHRFEPLALPSGSCGFGEEDEAAADFPAALSGLRNPLSKQRSPTAVCSVAHIAFIDRTGASPKSGKSRRITGSCIIVVVMA